MQKPVQNQLLRLPAVMAATGLSRSGIYARVAEGEFPGPIKIGPRATAWAEAEIQAWISDRIAARDAGRAA